MEVDKNFEYSIFDSLIDNDINFALYRLPNDNIVRLIIQKTDEPLQLDEIKELNNISGFVMVPFKVSENNKIIIIRPDILLTGEHEIFSIISIFEIGEKSGNKKKISIHPSSTFENYKSTYNTFIKPLEKNKLNKLVLSRTYNYTINKKISIGRIFQKAASKYKSSFVYLSNTSKNGTWFGISPELFISGNNNDYKTVALAGTKHISETKWDEKNYLEQKIVVDYIKKQLEQANCTYNESPTFTIRTADIEHLKTEFSFKIDEQKNLGDLLQLLHPTPAVCGYPKEEAFKFISEYEGYDRSYYSGFVGPLNLNNTTNLYVNLRCMEVYKDSLCLYAGGGLLSSSNVLKEWDETENKLQTILSLIERD